MRKHSRCSGFGARKAGQAAQGLRLRIGEVVGDAEESQEIFDSAAQATSQLARPRALASRSWSAQSHRLSAAYGPNLTSVAPSASQHSFVSSSTIQPQVLDAIARL
jgi:hypothetical protein